MSCFLRRLKSLGPTPRAILGCSRIGLKCLFNAEIAVASEASPLGDLLCKGGGGVGSVVTELQAPAAANPLRKRPLLMPVLRMRKLRHRDMK